jgi:hypothetical protein
MKRVAITLILILCFILPSKAQEKQEKLKELEELEQKTEGTVVRDTLIIVEQDTLTAEDEEIIIDDEESYDEDPSTVTIGGVTVEESDDETVIRIGKKGVRIVEDGDDTKVTFEEYYDDKKSSFRGHVGGFELGFCGYFTEPFSTSFLKTT